MNGLIEADAAITKATLPLKDTWTADVLGWVSKLSDQPQLRMLCAGIIVAGLVRGDRRQANAGARMLVAHEAATAAKTFIKRRVDRRRPRSLDGDAEASVPEPGNDPGKEESSFPSGHSAGAAAVAAAFGRVYPEHRTAAWTAAAAAALVQIPRCAHYPTDVGAGVVIGVAAEALTSRLVAQASPSLTTRAVGPVPLTQQARRSPEALG